MAAVFAHGALRLYLLALLEDGPRHGYEIIKALDDRFGGTYTPSAGTVYPRLAKLEAEDLVATESAGRRTVYRITPDGVSELSGRRPEVAGIEEDISLSVRRLADDLRTDLRRHAAGRSGDGGISQVTAETIRTVLDQAKLAIQSTLTVPPERRSGN